MKNKKTNIIVACVCGLLVAALLFAGMTSPGTDAKGADNTQKTETGQSPANVKYDLLTVEELQKTDASKLLNSLLIP